MKTKGKERTHTTLGHAHFVALAKAAGLAALAAILVNGALVGSRADVVCVPWGRVRGKDVRQHILEQVKYRLH